MTLRLRPYPKYKPSGVEWLGEIPAAWSLKRLKHLTQCLDGKRIPLNSQQRGDMQGEFPYWGANGIVDRVNDWLFDEQLVLLGEDGAPFFDPFKDVAFNVRGQVWVNNHIHVLRPIAAVVPEFLTYCLNATDYAHFIEGTTRDKLTQEKMHDIPIAYPSLLEQRAIAAFLDRETARIDALIEKKQRQIELLQEKRAALITHAVTQGLNPSAPMKDSGVEWLGKVPAHWRVERAKTIFREIDVRSATGAEELLTVSHITGVTRRSEKNVTMFMAESLADYKTCAKNDLVINTMWAWMGAMGIAPEPGIVSPSYNVYRFRQKDCEPRYYDLLFRTRQFISEVNCQSKGVWTSRLRLYPEEFFEIRLPLPPSTEQTRIVAAIDKETGDYGALEERVEKSIATLREYRTALISAAVTGKIDARNQN